MVWNIVVGEEEEQNNPVGFSAVEVAERAAYRDYIPRQSQAAAIIYDSRHATTRAHLDETSDPADQRRCKQHLLPEWMEPTTLSVGRRSFARSTHCIPKKFLI